jgi:hypothetical protein
MTIDATKYPQLALMAAIQGQSQSIGEFIEWLGENGMAICSSKDGLRGTSFFPIVESTERLLARHFELDLNAAERERRQVLAEFAQTQAA